MIRTKKNNKNFIDIGIARLNKLILKGLRCMEIELEEFKDILKHYIYSYVYRGLPLFTRETIEIIREFIKGHRKNITLDLGYSYIEEDEIRYVDENICIDNICIDLAKISECTKTEDRICVYDIESNSVYPATIFDYTTNKFYKLKYLGLGVPTTLEISGIHMHRITDTNPYEDAKLKVLTLRRLKKAIVLDTCTGLGYTAIMLRKYGAEIVITSEIDENVISLSMLNPWSKNLQDKRILTLHCDVVKVLELLPDESITHILHDPPRFNIAPNLYSIEIYREFYRVLKYGGRLYHYTGEPGKHYKTNLLKGIKSRLEKAGFKVLRWDELSQGFIAIKI